MKRERKSWLERFAELLEGIWTEVGKQLISLSSTGHSRGVNITTQEFQRVQWPDRGLGFGARRCYPITADRARSGSCEQDGRV